MRFAAGIPAYQGHGQNHLLRRQGRLVDAVAQQVNGSAGFFLQLAFNGTNGLGKVDVSQNIIKPDDGKILLQSLAAVFQHGNQAPGLHIAE